MHATSSLEFKNVGISFGSRTVLIDTSLCLQGIGVGVLVGVSDSEKSLLLSSLAGLHSNSPSFKQWGEIYISGKLVDINNQDPSSRPILVRSIISELNHSVESLILSNYKIAKGDSITKQEFLNKLMIDYGLEELLPMLKHRLIEIQPVWQRIVFTLIAAAKKPSLLMLDEPTKGLKHKEVTLIMRFIRHLGKQLKVVMSLDSLAEARQFADHIILLAGGRVHFYGKNEVFFAKIPPSDIVNEFIQTGNIRATESDISANSLITNDAATKFSQANVDSIKSVPGKKENSKPVNHLEAAKTTEVNFAQAQDKASATQSPEKSESNTQEELTPAKRSAALLTPSKEGAYLVAEIGLNKSNDLPGPDGFYWVVPGVLAACLMPGITDSMGYDLGLLASLGITKLVTLSDEDLYQAELEAAGLSNVHLPMPSSGMPSLTQLHMLLLRLQQLIEDMEVLAIHSLDSLGMSSTVIAAWMIKEGQISAEETIIKLTQIHPDFAQNEAQVTFLFKFESDILRRLK